jgi:hypothetical protein
VRTATASHSPSPLPPTPTPSTPPASTPTRTTAPSSDSGCQVQAAGGSSWLAIGSLLPAWLRRRGRSRRRKAPRSHFHGRSGVA